MADWRQAERALAQAEAEMLAPWRAAIRAARAKRREVYAARTRAAAVTSHRRQIAALQRAVAARDVAERGAGERVAGKVVAGESPVREPEVAKVNPIYLEIAPRAAGLRGRSDTQTDDARADAVLAPDEINPSLMPGQAPIERRHAAPMGSQAQQASLTAGAAGFLEGSRTGPIQRETPGRDSGG
jgi:hypothetical protein